MNWISEEQNYIFQTYRRQTLILVKGKGSFVWDQNGKKYIDFFSGLGVNNLGHCHPAIVRAIHAQSKKLLHTSNLYYTLPQIELARELIKRTFPGKVFFSNSGAEANECGLKLARRWGNREEGIQKNEMIAFRNSFHGRTLGTLSLTGQEKFQKGFEPLISKVLYAQFNDFDSVKKLTTERTSAVIVEPVQGEGGVYPARKGFLLDLREWCDQKGLLLIFDEVQCGLGRSGSLFCFQHYGVVPDVLVLAKGLGGGLPIGATIANEKSASLFLRGDHASTFGGNPVVCASALAVLKEMNQKLLDSVQKKGGMLGAELDQLKNEFPSLIQEIRGIGLMIGVELKTEGDSIVNRCRENGLLVNCTQRNILRFLPPLNMSLGEIQSALKILKKSLVIE